MRKRRDRRSHAIFAGLLLILLGGLLFLASIGLVEWSKWWQLFLIGLGVILLLDAFIFYGQDKDKKFPVGRIIPAIVLIIIGAAFLFSAANWWALIIVAVGVMVLAIGLWRRPSD